MGSITKQQEENMEAGTCTRCGVQARYRNSAGQCMDCHNLGYHERKSEQARLLAARRAEGVRYWAERGMQPGDRVYRVARHMLAPVSIRVDGTAKVGAVGAYVHSSFQAGYLSPAGWHKADTAGAE